MTANYQQLNDPAYDLIPLPVETSDVDLVIGGFGEKSYTDLVIGASNTLTSALNPFVAGDVGKILVITGGTNFTKDSYVIADVTDGVATVGTTGEEEGTSPGTEAATGGTGYLVTDCRGLLILGEGNLALATQKRPTIKETLTGMPVGLFGMRLAKVYSAGNGTTATKIFAVF